VPEELSSILKQRAAAAGLSLSDYVLNELSVIAARPTLAELNSRIEIRHRVDLPISIVDLVRADRDNHDMARYDASSISN